jgi:hypothetical protein
MRKSAMINQALRRFCDSPHRPLIVIAGTLVVALLLLPPLVDVYSAGRADRKALSAELELARESAARVEGFESRLAERLARLAEFEDRAVDDRSLAAVRGKLVDLAKEAGCSLRRLNVGATSSRAWSAGDDPLALRADPKRSDASAGFNLEWRPITISVSGTSANLQNLLERIAATGILFHAKSLDIYPSSPSRQSLTLDIELWCYTLAARR